MRDTLDLDAYLRRIGHDGARTATAATLRSVVLAHTKAIAFENLDPLLGRPVRLDVGSIQRKLIAGGRGGYCFEHNLLIAHALRALGFAVTGLAARVVLDLPPGAMRPRTHMLLLVGMDGGTDGGRAIVDVGFGGLTPTAPLRLETDAEQPTPHEPFRLDWVDRGDGGETGYRLDVRIADTWTPLYAFDLQAQHDADFEMMNHYTATHPASTFRNALMAARVTDDARYGLRDAVLSVHRRGAPSQRRTLDSVAAIRDTLADPFGISLPDDPALDPALDAALARLVGETTR